MGEIPKILWIGSTVVYFKFILSHKITKLLI
ncbi:predicted protein [Sclerotinia sclerotiorum 1980 UF-70]|uniref:Uncharacterized protein n=1 Tax=Sclerotinia sclerotiorum (strain ATCC 18683 / 1980 / Ss-1) TaxID=665079 RepID=A7E5D7_SCLS1|nr:predicted protein [Sclerotinia sclerotiorum 1980 UF-70]EDN91109.1 predicted protein [Sclerotinia sclerotiorum 1980 UF-70]